MLFFKTLAGRLLCNYFTKLEAKAWKHTEHEPLINVLSWGMGEEWYTIAESNSRYYAYLKTNYGKPSLYTGYYMNLYMLRVLIKSRIYRFFGKKHTIKPYDPFNPIKNIFGYFLHRYFIYLKQKATYSQDYYYTLSWGNDEAWFNLLGEEAKIDANIKTEWKLYPRYYRYYFERYIFIALLEELI